MATTNQDTKVVTDKVRISYVSVLKPKKNDRDEDVYACVLLIPKTNTALITKLKAAIDAARISGATILAGKKGKNPIHDGDGEKPNGGEYGAECKEHWVVNVSSKQKPSVVKPNGVDPKTGKKIFKEITDTTEIYSGCYARVSINMFAFNNAGNCGIAAGLNNICKVSDGDYLGGRAAAEDDFGDDFEYDESQGFDEDTI